MIPSVFVASSFFGCLVAMIQSHQTQKLSCSSFKGLSSQVNQLSCVRKVHFVWQNFKISPTASRHPALVFLQCVQVTFSRITSRGRRSAMNFPTRSRQRPMAPFSASTGAARLGSKSDAAQVSEILRKYWQKDMSDPNFL